MDKAMEKELPCMREKCIGRECANFGERGCKGGEHPPWSWAKWYIEELPKIKRGRNRNEKTTRIN